MFFTPYSSIFEHPQVIKYFGGVYNLRPPTQIITFVWAVKILFHHFNQKGGYDQLSDKGLTQYILVLLSLLGGQRMNTIFFHSKQNDSYRYRYRYTYSPNHVLKHSKPGKKLAVSTPGHTTAKVYVL